MLGGAKLGRPVKWRGERSEAFFFDPYGRDLNSVAELALDADGKFLAVRTHNIQNLGSQTLHLVPLARGAAVTNGVYAIPAVYARLQRGFHQRQPDLDLSRRRTAGGDVRHRAAHRYGGGRDGH